MFFARAESPGTLPKTADAAVYTLNVGKRVVWLAGLLTTLSTVISAQSLNVSFTEYRTPVASAGVYDIVRGSDGALWFTELYANKIGRVTTAGVMTEYPLPTPLTPGGTTCAPPNNCGPTSITAGPDGALWFSDSHGIGRLTTSGIATLFPIQANVEGITSGPDGALWFTELPALAGTTSAIGRITTDGAVTEYKLASGVLPASIISGPDGALWFVEGGNGSIGRIATAGVITQYPVPRLKGSADFGKASAVGSDGAIWFEDGNDTIGRITTAGVVTEYSIGTFKFVGAITRGPDGALWFTSFSQIGRITTSGAVTFYDIPQTTGGQLGITIGPDGALWVAEGIPPNTLSGVLRVQVPTRTGVLSHIAAGGGWDTTITLINTSSSPVSTRVAFYADNGTALSLPLNVTQQGASQAVTGSTLDKVINPNSTLLVNTGPLASTVVGWADVTSTSPLGGFAIFRSTPQTGSPSEGTVPLQSQFPSTITLAYENTSGFVMGVALANLSTVSSNIIATIWDDSGTQLGTQNITIAGNGHMSLVLPNQVPLTNGKRGIVQFQNPATGGITGLGLRFSPFSTFTSVPTILGQ